MTHITDLRLQLIANGYVPLAVTTPDAPRNGAGKAPLIPGWRTIEVTPDVVRGWETGRFSTDTNTGIRCDNVIAVDVDVLDAALVERIVAVTNVMLGPTPLQRIGRDPKRLHVYQANGDIPKLSTLPFVLPDGTEAQVEYLAQGQQFVAFGKHPMTRRDYRWVGPSVPQWTPVAELPAVTIHQLQQARDAAADVLLKAGGRPKVERKQEQPESQRQRGANQHDPDTSLITQIRARLDLAKILTDHGYDENGGLWRHPHSQSKIHGGNIKNINSVDKFYSFNAGDPLNEANLPTWCGIKAPDAFDVVCILDFDSDRPRALAELGKRFGLMKPQERKAVAATIYRLVERGAPDEAIWSAAYAQGESLGLSHADVRDVARYVVAQARKAAA